MATRTLSDIETTALIGALMTAADTYRQCALKMHDAELVAQFRRQATEADTLREALEEYPTITVSLECVA